MAGDDSVGVELGESAESLEMLGERRRVVRDGIRDDVAGDEDFFLREVEDRGAGRVANHVEELKFAGAAVESEFVGEGKSGVDTVDGAGFIDEGFFEGQVFFVLFAGGVSEGRAVV